MNYAIAYNHPGRLRVRLGAHRFTAEQGYGICAMLMELSGVCSAVSNHINGGILVCYDREICHHIFSLFNGLNRSELPEHIPSNEQVKNEAKLNFQCTILSMAIKKVAFDAFLPAGLFRYFVIFSASRYIKRALAAVWRKDINVDVLDGAAIAASIGLGEVKAASAVMLLLTLSEHIADYTRYRAKNILIESLALNVDKVWLVKEGAVDVQVPLQEIEKGDTIRVQMGYLIPVDGRVISGEAVLNESSMTGESAPAFKKAGKSVFAGTVIEEGMLVIQVYKKSQDTRISQIIAMIEDGEEQKSRSQSKMEYIADKIVPYNFALFALVLLLTRNVRKALAVLMVDYSCALKLVTPITVISAMRQCAEHGILVKGGKYLESFAEADTVIFDKTGTLTSASPSVAKVISLCDMREDEILRMAACLEEHFPHSVANAIVKEAAKRGLEHEEKHTDIKYIVAHGICANYEGEETIIGSSHFVLEDEKVSCEPDVLQGLSQKIAHYSPIYIARKGRLIGLICIDDPQREEAKDVILSLREQGIKRIIMLTGDNNKTAQAIATKLSIDEVYAELLPQEKANFIELLREEGHRVIMVGDGVNDAPALAKADVSVSLKDASDIAKEVADIVISSGDLRDMLYLRQLSKVLTTRVVHNFRFAVGFNSGLLGLGLVGVDPVLTSFLHNFSTMGLAAFNTRDILAKDKVLRVGP